MRDYKNTIRNTTFLSEQLIKSASRRSQKTIKLKLLIEKSIQKIVVSASSSKTFIIIKTTLARSARKLSEIKQSIIELNTRFIKKMILIKLKIVISSSKTFELSLSFSLIEAFDNAELSRRFNKLLLKSKKN